MKTSKKKQMNDSDEEPTTEPRAMKSARDKVMDLLARRNHSDLELRRKLSRFYPMDDVEDAIANAKAHGWMAPPEEISERVAVEMSRKKKGHRFINQFLKNKGLPSVAKDSAHEIEKGLAIVLAKMGKAGPFDRSEQQKIYRLLINRGFDDDTIRRVLARAD